MERAGFETRAEAETACLDQLGITPVQSLIKRKSGGRYEIIQINPNSPVTSLYSASSSDDEGQEDELDKEKDHPEDESKEDEDKERAEEEQWFELEFGREDQVEYI